MRLPLWDFEPQAFMAVIDEYFHHRLNATDGKSNPLHHLSHHHRNDYGRSGGGNAPA